MARRGFSPPPMLLTSLKSLFDGRFANRDEPCLVSGELLSRLMEFLAGQGPAPEPLGDDARFLAEVESSKVPGSRAMWCLELARLHTALAQVAATALNSDGRACRERGPPAPP